jgi:HEPN domain-containing protein
MISNEIILKKFEKLKGTAQRIFQECGWDNGEWDRFPNTSDYLTFRVEVTNLVEKICGKNSSHYLELRNIANSKEMVSNPYYFSLCSGILEAAYNDFTEGFLADLKLLVSADIFIELLEQAETLFKADYYIPAASLAGAILEDTLKKICIKQNIEIPDKPNINKLNSLLAKEGIYEKLQQKRITTYADVRNNADHGDFDKFKKEDVEDMLKWIPRFQEEYLL